MAANALAHAAGLRAAAARVVVFPELSLTGYELDAATLEIDDLRLKPLIDACTEMGSVALVGAPVQGDSGRPNIAMLAVDAGGARIVYRKLWLGQSEQERFGPGSHPVVLEVDGWRLGLAICKDTGVSQHAADTAALGIDVYVAGTLMSVEETEIQNERGRRLAREHQSWVAFASFAGSTGDGYDHAAGCSAIWSPDAGLAAQAGAEVGAFARMTLTAAGPESAAH